MTSSHRGGLRLLCAAVALAAALCAVVMTSGAPDDMSMSMSGPTSTSTSTSVATSASDLDRLAPIGCEGTCAGDATTACAASVLVAITLLPLLGRSRAGLVHLGPRGSQSAAPPGVGRQPLARHVAAPSLLGVLRV